MIPDGWAPRTPSTSPPPSSTITREGAERYQEGALPQVCDTRSKLHLGLLNLPWGRFVSGFYGTTVWSRACKFFYSNWATRSVSWNANCHTHYLSLSTR